MPIENRIGGSSGIGTSANITPPDGGELDISAYLGGVVFADAQAVSRTGGITYGYCNIGIDGWNGSAWVNIVGASVGGSGSDVWLYSNNRAMVTNNPYSKLRMTGGSANNAGSARWASAFGAK